MAIGPLLYGSEGGWRLDPLRQVATTNPSGTVRGWAGRRLELLPIATTATKSAVVSRPSWWPRPSAMPPSGVAISRGTIMTREATLIERTARTPGHGDVRTYGVAPDIGGCVTVPI